MIGQTISHYRITEKLGEGGMGVVCKAEDTQLRRTVALKFLAQQGLNDPETKARLIREAQAATALDHPNICSVHGIHEENGHTFIAMAFIDGVSLADKIKQRPLAFDEALSIAIQTGDGLQEAHERGAPRYQAGEHHADAQRPRQDHGLRPGLSGGPQQAHQERHDAGHASLHVAGTGSGTTRRPPQRYLVAGICALRDDCGPAAFQ